MTQNSDYTIGKYVDLLSDAGFKAVFADEDNKPVIISFLNRLLRGERVVQDILFLNNEELGKSIEGKGVRFDLHCLDTNGVRFIVEMQKSRHDEDFFYRSVYYGARAFELQQSKGSRSYFCQPVYVIGIMEGSLPHEAEEQVKTCVSTYRFRKDETGLVGPTTICCIFVQLGFFLKDKNDCIDLLDQWCYCLKNAQQLSELPESFCSEEIENLRRSAEFDKFNPQKQELYISKNMFERDYIHDMYFEREDGIKEGLERGRAEGMEKGMEKGIVTGKTETAKNLLSCGIDIQTIAKCTGLSIEDIQKLRS